MRRAVDPDVAYDDMRDERDREAAMQERARAMARGTLSAEEIVLVGDCPDDPFNPDSVETITSLLYSHVSRACRLRMAMDSEKAWSRDYHAMYVDREQAIEDAFRHLRRLQARNVELDQLLLQMMRAEGIGS